MYDVTLFSHFFLTLPLIKAAVLQVVLAVCSDLICPSALFLLCEIQHLARRRTDFWRTTKKLRGLSDNWDLYWIFRDYIWSQKVVNMFANIARRCIQVQSQQPRHCSNIAADMRRVPTYHPDYIDKSILVHYKHYPSVAAVPDRVDQHVMDRVK